jgi:hypothetical protein
LDVIDHDLKLSERNASAAHKSPALENRMARNGPASSSSTWVFHCIPGTTQIVDWGTQSAVYKSDSGSVVLQYNDQWLREAMKGASPAKIREGNYGYYQGNTVWVVPVGGYTLNFPTREMAEQFQRILVANTFGNRSAAPERQEAPISSAPAKTESPEEQARRQRMQEAFETFKAPYDADIAKFTEDIKDCQERIESLKDERKSKQDELNDLPSYDKYGREGDHIRNAIKGYDDKIRWQVECIQNRRELIYQAKQQIRNWRWTE